MNSVQLVGLGTAASRPSGRVRSRKAVERVIYLLLFGCAGVSVITTVSIVIILLLFSRFHF